MYASNLVMVKAVEPGRVRMSEGIDATVAYLNHLHQLAISLQPCEMPLMHVMNEEG